MDYFFNFKCVELRIEGYFRIPRPVSEESVRSCKSVGQLDLKYKISNKEI